MTPIGFGILGPKTTGYRFEPQNPREDLRAARDVMGELASR